MAKKSMLEREQRRERAVTKYAKKRAQLKATVNELVAAHNQLRALLAAQAGAALKTTKE